MAKRTFIANADLTDKIGYAVKLTNGKADLASVAGEACVGILMNDNKAGMAVGVGLVGEVVKAKLGGAVNAGAKLACGENGKLATLEDEQEVVAVALEAGAENDLIYVVIK